MSPAGMELADTELDNVEYANDVHTVCPRSIAPFVLKLLYKLGQEFLDREWQTKSVQLLFSLCLHISSYSTRTGKLQ